MSLGSAVPKASSGKMNMALESFIELARFIAVTNEKKTYFDHYSWF